MSLLKRILWAIIKPLIQFEDYLRDQLEHEEFNRRHNGWQPKRSKNERKPYRRGQPPKRP